MARFAGDKAAALIIVLAIIVLIAAVVIGFLFRAGTSRITTSSYSAKVSTRRLADMVVNLVQGQINDATGQGSSAAWASQPGAVRVFDDTGALLNIYRLYSSTSMTTATPGDLANDVPVSGTWESAPATWVDLNAPIAVQGVDSTGTNPVLTYPILDPRDPTNPGTAANPGELSVTKMPGFFLGTSNGTGTVPGTTAVPTAGGANANIIPMPVRWMYVLQDGSIVAPTVGKSGGNSVTIASASGTNPIVGRVAFWTDDDSCKVNINTAAGSLSYRPDPTQNYKASSVLPAPWDTPRFANWDEFRLFAQDQPVHNEYQRYPGHPATTVLYNILNGLGMPFLDGTPQYPPDGSASYLQSGFMAAPNGSGTTSFFGLLPRYSDAWSSNGGLAATILSGTAAPPVTLTGTVPSRLYTSLGEFIYGTATTTGSNGTIQRAKNMILSGFDVTRQQVETGKFFLTAHSRAPEINLFGTPRISMWPIDSDYGSNPTPSNATTSVSPFDKLIAFCTTSGSGSAAHEYYFQRHDSTSPTNDFDGSNFTGYTAGNGTGIKRNQQLYAYLQYLMGKSGKTIPGFGGSFSTKYGTSGESDQILTEMMDYIRSTNETDHSNTNVTPFSPAYGVVGGAQVTPLRVPGTFNVSGSTTQGLGRMFTISEVGLHIIATADGNSTLQYVAPVKVGGNNVSTVKGSANDYRYVSNLPVAQYLLDAKGNQVGLNLPVTSGSYGAYFSYKGGLPGPGFPRNNNSPGTAPFPANPTLADQYGGALTMLSGSSKRLQAALIIEVQCPMQGYDRISWPDCNIKVSGLENIQIGSAHPFPGTADGVMTTWGPSRLNAASIYGGYELFQMVLTTLGWGSTGWNSRFNGWSGTQETNISGQASLSPNWPSPAAYSAKNTDFRFVSNPFTVADNDSSATLSISGGPVTIEIQVTPKSGPSAPQTVQTFNLNFPATTTPTPDLMQYGVAAPFWDGGTYYTSAADWWGFDNRVGWAAYPPAEDSGGAADLYLNNGGNAYQGIGCFIRADPPGTTPASTSGAWTYMTSAWIPVPAYKTPAGAPFPTQQPPSDVIRTLIARDGDVRLVMAKSTVNADGVSDMTKTAGYNSATVKLEDNFQVDTLADAIAGCDLGGSLAPGLGPSGTYQYSPIYAPKVPSTLSNGATKPPNNLDWDSGLPLSSDGAYANKPDEGNIYTNNATPYYENDQSATLGASNFTANRIIPSPVMFGSLPTGVMEDIPWRTLLFRPAATVSDGGAAYQHDSLGGPPDHLLLDLFTMPVVEPYAISEPFSTAGKINMNYQIVPFTYITRDTGVRAVLGSELIARVPLAAAAQQNAWTTANYYKGPVTGMPAQPTGASVALLPLNLDEFNGTLKQFSDKFAGGGIFKSASEICDQYLVPEGYTWPGFDVQWYGNDFALVGNNVRDRPYADIYPRLTTQSNTFTVHFKVQVLKQPVASDQTQWVENPNFIKAEYQGSTTIERYLDPTDSQIPDYGNGTDPTAMTPIEAYYKWRIIANNAFPP